MQYFIPVYLAIIITRPIRNQTQPRHYFMYASKGAKITRKQQVQSDKQKECLPNDFRTIY